MSDSGLATCDNTTFHGLQFWYVKIVEKYGWMVLGSVVSMNCSSEDKQHKKMKIRCYLSEIESFCKHCEVKMKQLTDEDRKQDIQIIYNKIKIFNKNIIIQLSEMWKNNTF